MNAEIKILKKNNIDEMISLLIIGVLVTNQGITLSSNQIFSKLPNNVQVVLDNIASQYIRGACSKPAAYVGSVASWISKNNSNITHDITYFCPILQRKEDGFVWR